MDNILLKEKGYIFKVRTIKGRFGNILICLENLLLLAKNTESMFTIKSVSHEYETFKIPKLIFDFRSNENNNCNKVIEHEKLFLTKYPYDRSLFIDHDQLCLKYIYGLIKKQKPLTNYYDNTLILNIRGGSDIFKKKRISHRYIQPPFSYYKHIIKNNDHEDILLITDSIKYNPVIKKLLNLFCK